MPVLARKPGALRNGAPFKDWVLPAALERVRRKLDGADDGDRQMVDILAAVLTRWADGRRGRLRRGARATASTPPMSSSTSWPASATPPRRPPSSHPHALRLQHAPLADCARYDSLRRTV